MEKVRDGRIEISMRMTSARRARLGQTETAGVEQNTGTMSLLRNPSCNWSFSRWRSFEPDHAQPNRSALQDSKGKRQTRQRNQA